MERPVALTGRLTVPWATVVPLAVVMAYADGFWLTSLRGAVGAIESTQGPFVSWFRESTLALPVFVVAVLGALTLAMHMFGSVLRTSRALLATALLIVAAGTGVGIADIAVSSAYDYHLQSAQPQLMDSVHDICAGGNCLAQQQRASFDLQVQAVGVGSGILLVTNLVLVGWVVALRGGRLSVSSTRHRTPAAPGSATPAAVSGPNGRVDDLRLLLVGGLSGTAAIHVAESPGRMASWAAAGTPTPSACRSDREPESPNGSVCPAPRHPHWRSPPCSWPSSCFAPGDGYDDDRPRRRTSGGSPWCR